MSFKFESLADEETQSFLDSFKDIIPEELNGSSISELGNADAVGFPSVVEEILSVFTAERGSLASFLLFMMGMTALMSLASFMSGKLSKTAQAAIMILSGVTVFARLYGVILQITQTVGGVLNFFAAFIPIMTGAVAYGGGVGSAAVCASGANMTLGIIGTFILPIMNSCAALIFALGLVGGIGGEGTGKLAARVKSIFMWLVGLSSVLLLSALALQTAIASSQDTAVMRAAKYAATGTIPIVGGSVSSAMGTLVTGVSYIKSTVGTGAVSVLLLLTLSPLVMLLAYRFIISLGEGMLELLDAPLGAKMLGAFKSAFDVVMAVFALTVTVLIIEIALMMKSGVGVI